MQNCRIGQSGQWPKLNFWGRSCFFLVELQLSHPGQIFSSQGVCADSCRIVELAKVAKVPVAKIMFFGQKLFFSCRTVAEPTWLDFLFLRGCVHIPVELQNWPKWPKRPEAKVIFFGQELYFPCRTVVSHPGQLFSFQGGMCRFLQNCRIGQSGQSGQWPKSNFLVRTCLLHCRTVVEAAWPDFVFDGGMCIFLQNCRIGHFGQSGQPAISENLDRSCFFLVELQLSHPGWIFSFQGVCAYSCRIVELAKVAIVASGQSQFFWTGAVFSLQNCSQPPWPAFLILGGYVQIPVELQNWPKWPVAKVIIFWPGPVL